MGPFVSPLTPRGDSVLTQRLCCRVPGGREREREGIAGTGENLLVTMALRWGLSPPERRQARGPFLRELLTPSSVPQLLPGPRRSPVSSTPTALHVWLERAAVHPLKPGIKCPLPCRMFASCLSLSPLNALSTASLLMLTILNLKIDFLSHLYHLVA